MKYNSPQAWERLFLTLAMFFGTLVRSIPIALSDFPLNDGGMFFVMSQELRASNYRLPLLTDYNNLNIPYTYPPLSFYLANFSADILGLDLISIFRWLPLALTLFSLPLFYFMARRIAPSPAVATLATLAFAFFPRTYSWFVLGGGISRATYLLAYLLAAAFTYTALLRGTRVAIFAAIVSHTAVVLAHPEAGFHSLITGAIFWFILAPNRIGLIRALGIGLGVLGLSAIWWLPALSRHGLDPFVAAVQTGGHNWFSPIGAFLPLLGSERYITIFTVFGILGMGLEIQTRRWLLPIWFTAPLLISPRSASAISIIPFAIAAGIGLNHLLVNLPPRPQTLATYWSAIMGRSGLARAGLAYTLLLGLLGSFSYSLDLSRIHLSAEGHSAMDWVQENTSPESRFLLITGAGDGFADPAAEWFPALTRRHSVATIQGREWLLGREFTTFRGRAQELQRCLNIGLACVANWAQTNAIAFDYLYIQKHQTGSEMDNPGVLLLQIRAEPTLSIVFENSAVVIADYRAASIQKP